MSRRVLVVHYKQSKAAEHQIRMAQNSGMFVQAFVTKKEHMAIAVSPKRKKCAQGSLKNLTTTALYNKHCTAKAMLIRCVSYRCCIWQLWRLTSVLLSGRSADGPAIVAADKDDRSAQCAGKVDSSVKVPFRCCAFSKVHCHTCLLTIQLCCTQTPAN